MRNFLSRYARSKTRTLKYEFALVAFAVWGLVTARLFLSGNDAWVAAQGVNYATLSSSVFLFITAAVGLQAWQNTQGPPGGTEPGYETGEPPSPASPEDAARRVG